LGDNDAAPFGGFISSCVAKGVTTKGKAIFKIIPNRIALHRQYVSESIIVTKIKKNLIKYLDIFDNLLISDE